MRDLWSGLFFLNDRAPTEISTLSLHHALPFYLAEAHLLDLLGLDACALERRLDRLRAEIGGVEGLEDRKSTRLNSSHANISYAVFCLKKKTSGAGTLRPLLSTPASRRTAGRPE